MRDEVAPNGRWEFDTDVTDVFDDMLERSIPQYDVMRDVVFQAASKFQQKGTDIVDLGCSRG
jgi:tRNA (cmo5U34)-methyltransferase